MTDLPKIYYYYLRDKNNRPIGTVAFCLEAIEKSPYFPAHPGVAMVTRGMSLCCPTDNVNKAKGREIAERKCLRYRKKKIASPKVITRAWWGLPYTTDSLISLDYCQNQGYYKPANEIERKILKIKTI